MPNNISRKCILNNCESSKSKNCHFFKIPNSAHSSNHWKQFFEQNNVEIDGDKSQFICQLHFTPEMINYDNPLRIRLKPSAFPVRITIKFFNNHFKYYLSNF